MTVTILGIIALGWAFGWAANRITEPEPQTIQICEKVDETRTYCKWVNDLELATYLKAVK